MSQQRSRTAVVLAGIAAVLLTLGLSACAPASDSGDQAGSDGQAASDDQGGSDAAPADESDDDAAFDGVVLPGTGSYAIGTEAPFGGYQLTGEPDEQPVGCTWSIQDADGAATFEDQGIYVFLTDIPEAVTFVTNGCPDWEQFE